MHPADVLEAGEMHVGYAVGVAAPLPARETPAVDDEQAVAEAAASQLASPAGFVQDLQLRVGLGGAWEAGLRASPSSVAVDARRQVAGDRKWVATVGAGVGTAVLPALVLASRDPFEMDSGHRVDVYLEALAGRSWSDVLRLWVGPRVGVGRFGLRGTVDPSHRSTDAAGTVGSAGFVLGLAAGYRYLFAFAEVAPTFLFSSATVDREPLGLSGFVLYPSFGLFSRI